MLAVSSLLSNVIGSSVSTGKSSKLGGAVSNHFQHLLRFISTCNNVSIICSTIVGCPNQPIGFMAGFLPP